MSKEYTTIEMLNLAQLPENQGKEIHASETDLNYVVVIKDNWIYQKNTNSVDINWHQRKNSKWTFVQKPVDFMTAAKSDKRIRPSNMPGEPEPIYHDLPYWLYALSRFLTKDAIELLNREWFIDNGDI